MKTTTYCTETLDSTERLAIAITRDQYAAGRITHDQLEARIHTIIGLDGPRERARVLHTNEVVDITSFAGTNLSLATAWSWPEDADS